MGWNRSGRVRLVLPLSTERWDSSKNLRGGLAFGLVLCALGAGGNWYNWFRGVGSLPLSIGLTIGALLIVLLAPRKWDLLAMSAGGTLGLEILGTLLRKAPVRIEIEAIIVTGAIFVSCEYIKLRLQNARLQNEAQHGTTRKD